MTPSSWLHLLHIGPHLYTRVSQATSMWCVWLGTASASRRRGATLEMPGMAMTSNPTVTPTLRGVTFVENSSGVFTSKVYAVGVSIGESYRKTVEGSVECRGDFMTKLCYRLHRADTTDYVLLSTGSSGKLPEVF